MFKRVLYYYPRRVLPSASLSLSLSLCLSVSPEVSLSPDLPVREEDLSTNVGRPLPSPSSTRRLETFVSTFGDEKAGSAEGAVALARETSTRWEQTHAELLLPLFKPSLDYPNLLHRHHPLNPSSMTSTSAIPSPCILPSPNPPC